MNPESEVPAADRIKRSLAIVREQIAEAVSARKCHTCGCLRSTVEALAGTPAGQHDLSDTLASARAVLEPPKYDCLGCAICYPAVAANAFADALPQQAEGLDLCPTEAPQERKGWPPLPGDYQVSRHAAPVAVCTLNSAELAGALVRARPPGLCIAGTMHTENLGIERLIRNVLANPNVRFLVVCGEDTRQAIGHLPGQSLASLFRNGIDDRARIVGAQGKRPVLKNVSAAQVGAFRRQVELVDLVGSSSLGRIVEVIGGLAARDPGPVADAPIDPTLAAVSAREPKRLVPDPAGYFVVYPDAARARLVLEHYSNAGLLDCVLEGTTPAALYAEVVARELISRLDHAAYLGRELARAEMSLQTGAAYVQDRAAGEVAGEDERSTEASSCGCASECGGGS